MSDDLRECDMLALELEVDQLRAKLSTAEQALQVARATAESAQVHAENQAHIIEQVAALVPLWRSQADEYPLEDYRALPAAAAVRCCARELEQALAAARATRGQTMAAGSGDAAHRETAVAAPSGSVRSNSPQPAAALSEPQPTPQPSPVAGPAPVVTAEQQAEVGQQQSCGDCEGTGMETPFGPYCPNCGGTGKAQQPDAGPPKHEHRFVPASPEALDWYCTCGEVWRNGEFPPKTACEPASPRAAEGAGGWAPRVSDYEAELSLSRRLREKLRAAEAAWDAARARADAAEQRMLATMASYARGEERLADLLEGEPEAKHPAPLVSRVCSFGVRLRFDLKNTSEALERARARVAAWEPVVLVAQSWRAADKDPNYRKPPHEPWFAKLDELADAVDQIPREQRPGAKE